MEGRITSLDIPNRKIYVMGVPVFIPETATVASPTGRIQVRDIGGKPLPGRTQLGFLGGTAIVTGDFVNNQVVAVTVDVTPDENVLVGPIQWVDGRFTIMGKPISLIEDARMKGKAVNGGGFPVDLATSPEGA